LIVYLSVAFEFRIKQFVINGSTIPYILIRMENDEFRLMNKNLPLYPARFFINPAAEKLNVLVIMACSTLLPAKHLPALRPVVNPLSRSG